MPATPTAEEKIAALNLTLPEAPKPVGAYIPAARTGNLLFISGQLPLKDGKLLATGPVPSATTLESAQAAARQCVLNALAIAKAEVGSFDKITRVVRIGVFVQSDHAYPDQPKVANGASDLLLELLGHRARHARAAVGTNALPLNASVEIEFLFEVTP